MTSNTRRTVLAAGGLAAFAAGFSQTAERIVDKLRGKDAPPTRYYGLAPEPEFTVDPASGRITLNPTQQVSYTGCLGCTTQCGVRVRIDKTSGKVLRVTGNPYNPLSTNPELPQNVSVLESFVSLSRHGKRGLDGRSTACGRGNAVLSQIDSPYRVLSPLKRVGPRNSGKWAPISFEQLIREVVEGGDLFGEGPVEGLRALRDLDTPINPAAPELGPRANQVALMTSVNDGRDSLARRFIGGAFGSVNFVRHGSYCGGAWRSGSGAVFGDLKKMPHGRPDLENAEFVIFIGTAPGNAGNPFKRTGALVAKERATGKLEYVVIDPVLTAADNRAARHRTRWIPIRPGTDGALVMGLMRSLIETGGINTAWLSHPSLKVAQAAGEPSFSNASWLVITEAGHPRQGHFLRGSDLGWPVAETDIGTDADPGMVLDAQGQPSAADQASGPAPIEIPPTRVRVNGQDVAVETAYMQLKANVMQRSLAQCAEDCGIAPETIQALAARLAQHGRKASVTGHGGMMSGAGFYNAYGVAALNLLLGNVNWKGGLAINGGTFPYDGPGPRYNLAHFEGQIKPTGIPLSRNVPYEKTTEFRTRKAAGKPFPAQAPWYPNAPGLSTQWLTGAMTGYPYPLKALILWSVNPMYSVPGLKARLDKELADPRKIPLLISVDPMINESNAYADYIVPDSMLYESWGWTGPWNGVPTKMCTARWPVIEPRMDKTADGQRIGIEAFLIAVARELKLPGFGPNAIPDAAGQLHPLERAEDWFLRGGANVAFLGQSPVPDATDEDIEASGVSRILPHIKTTLTDDEWRKVAFLYTRGGRYQPYGQAQDADHPDWMTWRFDKALCLYNEKLGTSRNSLTGRRYSGSPAWQPPAFADGSPMRQHFPQTDWPMLVVSFKSPLQNSYSIATRLRNIRPDNPVIVHESDAARLGLVNGQSAWLETPGGRRPCTVLVSPGIMPGVIAVEHGYGHRELGARTHRIGTREIAGNPELSAGISLNDLGLQDPTYPGRMMWVDSVSGTAVRNGLPARLTPA
ncbi:molybdopterin dinucleotide binding domain-containing protein [Amphibiibacter pelophylacis]|uniref:Molybdopterin-dependent oxidoreductase n=1 Tax=Amphibiibacter pelophylacis TaxID=1799477 RepID=A0ACC6NYA7_9BURK